MATRLDRLLVLLDTGSNSITRKAAAQQLGEVQKLHPHELHNLLHRVHSLLKSSSWETRIAASQAIEAISKNVPNWDPSPLAMKVEKQEAKDNLKDDGSFRFDSFDILTVIKYGEPLLGSAGDEFDIDEDSSSSQGFSRDEQLSRQRLMLRKRLGLDLIGGVDLGMEGIIDEGDFIVNEARRPKLGSIGKQNSAEKSAELMAIEIAAINSNKGMSAREKNIAIRRAKKLIKQRSKDQQDSAFSTSKSLDLPEQPAAKKLRRSASVVIDQPGDSNKVLVDHVADNFTSLEDLEEWPFQKFFTELCNELFHPSWEVRHGAASGLREVIKIHGGGAGKQKSMTAEQMKIANREWLEDTALRLLCVFALDRFGDYVSDEVIAPVRETCAQTLGSVLQYLENESVLKILKVLMMLQEQDLWQIRHGGHLGIKYVLALKKELTKDILPAVLPSIKKGLQDDDVRAVAAATLVPVASELVSLMPNEVPIIVNILWEILLDLDDLDSSTKSVMCLLSSLIAKNMTGDVPMQDAGNLTELVPRLWPFLKHAISAVRLSVLDALRTLLARLPDPDATEGSSWVEPILADQLSHIFQRFILEPIEDISSLALEVWSLTIRKVSTVTLTECSKDMISTWLSFLVTPHTAPLDLSRLIGYRNNTKSKSVENGEASSVYFIGGITGDMDAATKEGIAIKSRLLGIRAVALLLSCLENGSGNANDTVLLIFQTLLQMLSVTSALQRMVATLVLIEWTKECKVCFCPDPLIDRLNAILSEQFIYDELIPHNQRLQVDTKGLVSFFAKHKIDVADGIQPGCFNLDTAAHLATVKFEEASASLKEDAKKIGDLKRRSLLVTIGQMKTEYQKLQSRVQFCAAGALISLKQLPKKLNPIIRPIMDGIKKEENITLQARTAESVADLLSLCVKRSPCPNSKIVKNLCSSVCCDQNKTPGIDCLNSENDKPNPPESDSSDEIPSCSKMLGILTLRLMQKDAAKAVAPKRGRANRANSGHSAASLGMSSLGMPLATNEIPNDTEEEGTKAIFFQTRGGELALSTTAERFGSRLQEDVPTLWETCYDSIQNCISRHTLDPVTLREDTQHAQNLILSLQVLETIATSLHPSLQEKLADLLDPLMQTLQYPFTALRHMVARVLGVCSKLITRQVMQFVIERILPLLGTSDNLVCRQGAIESIAHIIENLGMNILPYIVLLIVPLLGRMSDPAEDVRLVSTNCFATLIRYMPLEAGIPDPPGMSKAMIEQKKKERKFLEQLLNNTKLDTYDIPVPIKAELRKYQQDGVNWLAFLNKYKLHGILCDDMGLGKTLQSICIIAGDHLNRAMAYKATGSDYSKPLPSLVVCPPTLTGHWCYEVEKFCDIEHLNPLHYYGVPSDRLRLQRKLKTQNYNLVVASYDIVRNDYNFFLNTHWNYCVLDEGHIIKNSKTKLAKVIRQLKANHRLILSGTPIQNNVLELWSLFDFLMPGFLGTEKQFIAKFGKPILQSRDAKSSSKEQEAGVFAMEALHRQVLPFILRRMKEDVLQDLPPKIIQDYYCELSPLQVQLYEDFAKSRAKKELDVTVDNAISTNGETKEKRQGSSHIFQALQYLRKVCNHPSLVLSPNHPEYERIKEQLRVSKSSLHDIQNSSKLVALKQLLLDCGIGATNDDGNQSNVMTDPVVGQHRALIFCQLKSMLDIVENDLLKTQMPSVMYRRLDGSTPAGSRQDIVHRFNNDPSIDCLLLTTHVGGLGLNLTGADTVIFVEHDWNPSRDLQAMDRAHRIGQKKVVNVYRLISRGTLEEKIMGLQKFKLSIANSVITQDNSSLQSMDTSQLLDLFSVKKGKSEEKKEGQDANKRTSMKVLLEDIGELWDERQYENEYNLDSFIESLNTK